MSEKEVDDNDNKNTKINLEIFKTTDVGVRSNKKFCEKLNFMVRNPIESFTGRSKELNHLHEILQLSRILSVCGLSGIGKSELARKYAVEYGKEYDNRIVWINAGSYETLTDSFKRLCVNKLGISLKNIDGNDKDINMIVENVYEYFVERKCLMIFDNAEKRKIDLFLPLSCSFSTKCFVLITSCNRKWGKICVTDLDVFSKYEAIDFIKKALNVEQVLQEAQAEELSEKLQYFPLALQQAVSYIKEANNACRNVGLQYNIDDYLKEFEVITKKLLDYKLPEDSDDIYKHTIFTAWNIVINKLSANTQHGRQAIELLHIIAYLAPDNIPVELFLHPKLTDDDKRNLSHAIELLKQYSMIKTGQEQTSFKVHRLVQEVIRQHLKELGKYNENLKTIIILLNLNIFDNKKNLDNIHKWLPLLDAFLIHLYNDFVSENYYFVAIILYFICKLSEEYKIFGEYQRLKDVSMRALELLEKCYQFQYIDIHDTLANIDYAMRNLANNKRTGKLTIQYRPDQIIIVQILNNLATALGALGDYKKQDLLQKKTVKNLAIVIAHLKIQDDARMMFSNLQNYQNTLWNIEEIPMIKKLAVFIGHFGHFEEESLLLERILRIEMKYYGQDHVKISMTFNNLAIAVARLGDVVRSKYLLEQCLKIKEKHLKIDISGQISRCLNNELNFKILCQSIKEKQTDPDEIDLSILLNNLAIVVMNLGNHDKAKLLLELALNIEEKKYGCDSREITTTLQNISNILGYSCDYIEQRKVLERVLYITEKHYGIEHIEVGKALNNLAIVVGNLGENEEKIVLLEGVLSIEEKYYGSDHIELATTLNNLADAVGNLGNHDKKKKFIDRVLSIQNKYFQTDHFEIAVTLNNLANVVGILGDCGNQKVLLEQSLKIKEKCHGEEHIEVGIILNALGVVTVKLGDYTTAKYLLIRSLYILEKNYTKSHFYISIILNNLAAVLDKLEDHEGREILLERILSIEEKYYGLEHIEVAITIHNLVDTKLALKYRHEAKVLLERVMSIEEKYYGVDDIKVAETRNDLINVIAELGDRSETKALLEHVKVKKEKISTPF